MGKENNITHPINETENEKRKESMKQSQITSPKNFFSQPKPNHPSSTEGKQSEKNCTAKAN